MFVGVSCFVMSDSELFGDEVTLTKHVNLKRYPPSHAPTTSYISRVPAFLNLEPQPFDAEKFASSGKTDDELQLEANTVRWTYAAHDGDHINRVSNTRIVTWSDGSKTLQLGNEHFEIKCHKLDENAFICSKQTPENLLVTKQLVSNTMAFVPTSTSSATHAMLAKQMAKKHQNQQIRVGSVNTYEDPDKVQREIEKTEQAKDKARKKLVQQREDIISMAHYRSSSAGVEEEEEEEEEEEDDDMDVEDEEHASRLNKIKAMADSDEDVQLNRRKVLDDDDSS